MHLRSPGEPPGRPRKLHYHMRMRGNPEAIAESKKKVEEAIVLMNQMHISPDIQKWILEEYLSDLVKEWSLLSDLEKEGWLQERAKMYDSTVQQVSSQGIARFCDCID